VAVRTSVAASRPALAVVSAAPDTPIWISLLALVAMTMWPSALVWMVQLGYYIAGR
jgi:hypothetical protein